MSDCHAGLVWRHLSAVSLTEECGLQKSPTDLSTLLQNRLVKHSWSCLSWQSHGNCYVDVCLRTYAAFLHPPSLGGSIHPSNACKIEPTGQDDNALGGEGGRERKPAAVVITKGTVFSSTTPTGSVGPSVLLSGSQSEGKQSRLLGLPPATFAYQ